MHADLRFRVLRIPLFTFVQGEYSSHKLEGQTYHAIICMIYPVSLNNLNFYQGICCFMFKQHSILSVYLQSYILLGSLEKEGPFILLCFLTSLNYYLKRSWYLGYLCIWSCIASLFQYCCFYSIYFFFSYRAFAKHQNTSAYKIN